MYFNLPHLWNYYNHHVLSLITFNIQLLQKLESYLYSFVCLIFIKSCNKKKQLAVLLSKYATQSLAYYMHSLSGMLLCFEWWQHNSFH